MIQEDHSSMYELISIDNQLQAKLLMVFSAICKEIELLKKELEVHFLCKILEYGENSKCNYHLFYKCSFDINYGTKKRKYINYGVVPKYHIWMRHKPRSCNHTDCGMVKISGFD